MSSSSSLPQPLGPTDSPTFAHLNLTGTSDQITLSSTSTFTTTLSAPTPATQSQVITFPDTGQAATEVLLSIGQLTNKWGLLSNGATVSSAFPTALPLPSLDTTTQAIAYGPAGVGDTLVYTIPSGFYALVSTISVYNANAAASTTSLSISPDGGATKYFLMSTGSIATVSTGTVAASTYLFSEGESIMLTTTQTLQHIVGAITTFAVNSSPIQPLAVKGLHAGNTLVYTCPPDTDAVFVASFGSLQFQQGIFRVGQSSGGSITFTTTASIGGTTTTLSRSVVATSNSAASQIMSFLMHDGDTITVNASVGDDSAHFWSILAQFDSALFPAPPALLMRGLRAAPLLSVKEPPPPEEEMLLGRSSEVLPLPVEPSPPPPTPSVAVTAPPALPATPPATLGALPPSSLTSLEVLPKPVSLTDSVEWPRLPVKPPSARKLRQKSRLRVATKPPSPKEETSPDGWEQV